MRTFAASLWLLFLAPFALANPNHQFNLKLGKINIETQKEKSMAFQKVSVEGYENNKEVGAPALPVKSLLLVGTPKTIQVSLKIKAEKTIENLMPYPTQYEPCRCATDEKGFQYKESLYQESSSYKVSYVGAFRGVPLSRLDIYLASYDVVSNATTFKTDVEIAFNSMEFSLPKGSYSDYLIISTSEMAPGLQDFISWKKSLGYNVILETINSPNNTTAAISELIKRHYTESGTDFVMLIGDENMLPMFRVSTSGSSQTPSDLKYYTMDGSADYIPDMFASRIVAKDLAELRSTLKKSIEFEAKSFQDSSGLGRVIGIASNEGSNPSDNQYIQSIEKSFSDKLSTETVHLYQNDSVNSNPDYLNQVFSSGSFWLTYIGHGSGTSWPSMYRSYSTIDIPNIKNQETVKPIIIDVACQNGRLLSYYLGTSFMTKNQGLGAVAYFGGSVNISWHPPAIMAQGIASEHMAHNYAHLGEALLAGQIYLMAVWPNQSDVTDNLEWYHLQGDPGMNISFK